MDFPHNECLDSLRLAAVSQANGLFICPLQVGLVGIKQELNAYRTNEIDRLGRFAALFRLTAKKAGVRQEVFSQ